MEFVKACLDAMVPEHHPIMVIHREISFAFVYADFKKYYSQSNEGHPPIDPEILFRIVFVAHLEHLSYREVVSRLQHDVLYRAFTGWWKAGHPHHSTLSRFLDRVGSEPVAQAFNKVVSQARKKGIITDRLSSIDSTIVESHVNQFRLWHQGGSPDPGASWTKKRGKSYYGFKAHTACDVDSQMVTRLSNTPANQSDMTHSEPVVDEHAKAITADKGYSSGKNRQFLVQKKQEDCIIPKRNESVEIDRQKARGRTQVERNYSVVKRYHRLSATISWGQERFNIQSHFAFLAWNAKCWVKALFGLPSYRLKETCV